MRLILGLCLTAAFVAGLLLSPFILMWLSNRARRKADERWIAESRRQRPYPGEEEARRALNPWDAEQLPGRGDGGEDFHGLDLAEGMQRDHG